jgi:nitroreductase
MNHIVAGTVRPHHNITDLVELATRAPSLHNTQPWLFRPDGDAMEIWADPSRTLPVADPQGWATRIAIGAAAMNLRLGYALLDTETAVDPLPDSHRPDHLLSVRPISHRPASPLERALAAAIPRRHSNRRPYLDVPVAADVIARLCAAAEAEKSWLTFLSPAEVSRVEYVMALADRDLNLRPGYRDEFTKWVRAADGVPVDPLAGPPGPDERLRRREFSDETTEGGTGSPSRSRHYESDPCVAVLSTAGSSVYDDLRAGQALQRVLLSATDASLLASMYSQPIEEPEARAELAALCHRQVPQMVLRLGYGSAHLPTPRRPANDVLLAPASTT